MSPLEQRYRFLLRLLPATYRQAWEEDMVAAFLESVDAGDPETADLTEFARPSMSESLSVVSLAVRLHLDVTAAAPRRVAWVQAVRLATLMAVLANAVIVTGTLLITVWVSGRIGWLPAPAGWRVDDLPAGVWPTAGNLTTWAWVPAYIALTGGYRRAAQALGLLAILPVALSGTLTLFTGATSMVASSLATVAFDVLLILAMLVFPDGDPPAWRHRWLLALPLGVLLVPAPLFTAQTFVPVTRLIDWPGLACALGVIAVLTYQMAITLRPARRRLPTALALIMLTTTTAALRLTTLPGYFGQIDQAALLTLGLLQATILVAVSIPLATTTVRSLRHLPPLTPRSRPTPPPEHTGRQL